MALLGSPPPMGLPQPSSSLTPPSLYMLQWHEHHTSFFRLMEELCQSQSMTDVTVACGDVSLEAHSIILSASSPLLRSILSKAEGRKQTIHFMDMNPFHMQLLLQYMYRGEISVPQSDLGPLMQSAKALQIKGLSGGNSEEKISEFASYLAQQQQQQQHQQQQQQQQPQYQFQSRGPQQLQQPMPLLPTQLPPSVMASLPTMPAGLGLNRLEEMTSMNNVGKKRRSRHIDEHDKFDLTREKKLGLDYDAVSPDGGSANGSESKLLVKPRKTSRTARRKTTLATPLPTMNISGMVEAAITQHEIDDGMPVKLETNDSPPAAATMMAASNSPTNGEVGAVVDEDVGFDGDPFPSGSVSENWSHQHTMKVKGYQIPVLPKPLSQMKTTETRSYLSRLIWATNGWKRPQYGNPETKPVWWPDELLKWSEMKKMGGKKADGLSNVNYNEIQKNILCEGYKFFGFDPDTLCYVGTKEEKERIEEEHQRTATNLTTTTPTMTTATSNGGGGAVTETQPSTLPQPASANANTIPPSYAAPI